MKTQTELHTTIPIHPRNQSPKYQSQLIMLLFYQIHTTHLMLFICSSCVIISFNTNLIYQIAIYQRAQNLYNTYMVLRNTHDLVIHVHST